MGILTSGTRPICICALAGCVYSLRAGRVSDGQMMQSGKTVRPKSRKGVGTFRVPFLVMPDTFKIPPTGIEIQKHTECAYSFKHPRPFWFFRAGPDARPKDNTPLRYLTLGVFTILGGLVARPIYKPVWRSENRSVPRYFPPFQRHIP